MMRINAILLVGVPACGKTTWANEYVKENPNTMISERDNIRLNIQQIRGIVAPSATRVDFSMWDKKDEEFVTKLQRDQLKTWALERKDVIISDTNINIKFRNDMMNFLHNCGYETSLKYMDVPLEVALERDRNRPFPVGDDVIRRMYDTLQEELKTIAESS